MMTGQTIAHYTVLEKLGEGGMGVVYKAHDTKLDRDVALKFLPDRLNASPQDKARFIQEAKAASALNHPNVCTIHDILESDGRLFIVMEFVDGQTLRAKRGTFSEKQAIDVGIQVAEGLAAAHDKGIVHRDIKPENIMIRKDGIAQIMDFGLAKLRASGSAVTRLTKEGSTVGTAGYMSPEQVQGQESDHRSDIFSCGVLLYELLTGQLPFKGVHETALAYEIVNVDPPPMSALKPEIDPELDAIVLECLEKDPRERTQSIAQVALDLKRVRRASSRQRMSRVTAARPVAVASSRRHDAVAPETTAPAARLGWLPWALMALFALGLGALAVIHFRETPPVIPSLSASILPPQGLQIVPDFGGHMELSPDGSTLVFAAADSAGRSCLWVRSLRARAARQLPDTYGAQFPFWSPDNQSVAYFADAKLKKIALSGTPPVTVCDAVNGRGGTWNAEGVILFSPTFDLTGLLRVNAGGGTPVAVTRQDTARNETNHRWPAFLPDGKHFLYTTQARRRTPETPGTVRIGSLDGSMDTLLLKVASNAVYADGHLLYCLQNTIVAQRFDLDRFALTGDPTPIAERVNYSFDKSRATFSSAAGILLYQETSLKNTRYSLVDMGGTMTQLGDYFAYSYARFSHDGKRIVCDAVDPATGVSNIWIHDLARSVGTRFTFDRAAHWSPVWTKDDARIVFSSDASNAGDLIIKGSAGADSGRRLLADINPKVAYDVTLDGRTLVYSPFSATSREDIYTSPLDSTATSAPFIATEFSETYPRVSPDGRWIVYQSDESSTYEIYVRSFPNGGGKWQISGGGGTNPIWAPTGKTIYYTQPGGTLVAVEVTGGADAFIIGATHKLFKAPRSNMLDISPDGTRFVAITSAAVAEMPPFTIVTNWTSALLSH